MTLIAQLSTLDLLNSMFEEEVNFSIVGQLEKQQGDVYCGVFSHCCFFVTPMQYNQSPLD